MRGAVGCGKTGNKECNNTRKTSVGAAKIPVGSAFVLWGVQIFFGTAKIFVPLQSKCFFMYHQVSHKCCIPLKLFLLTFAVFGAAIGTGTGSPNKNAKKMDKALIVYYSWSGNTRQIAQYIREFADADIFEIKPAKPYPADYDECVKQAETDIKANRRPPLAQMPANLADYGIIFVGSPNWWSTIAPPVASFLATAALEGKTIVPFCTHGTGGQANLFADIAKLAPQSRMLGGFAIEDKKVGTAQPEVQKWLKNLGMIK